MLLSIKSFYFIFLIFSFLPLQASIPGGLKFHGSEQPINQRTSYNVFEDKFTEFSGYYNIDFKLSLYPTTEFGYILRIKNRESDRIYNLFYDGQGNSITFRFNEEGKDNLIVANLNREELLNTQWFDLKLSFDLKNDSIKLTIHGQSFGAGDLDLPDAYQPIILFGKSDHIIDVPSFAIKDLSVGNKKKYEFALKENQGNVVHDIDGYAYGKVSNPEWLTNDAYHWRYKVSFNSKSVAGSNYNPAKREIYYFNRDSLFIYNLWSGATQIEVFDEKSPVELRLGTNFIDTAQNRLYAYEVYYENQPEKPTVASLNLDTYEWTAKNYDQLPTQLHHHGSFFDNATREFTLFGGFGSMHYSKDFFTYSTEDDQWSQLEGFTGDFLSPRYFSSVGYLPQNNSIYIFGGMGNESGEQTVGRKYYYDLYRVDLDTKHITKLWEIPWEKDNVVPVRGMVIFNDSSFYTLCYPEHFTESFLKLYQFSLKDGSYKVFGDSIPIYSDKITTNANIYYNEGLNHLYAVVQEFDDNDISSDLKVYSLIFPPITFQELTSYGKTKRNYALLWIGLACALVIGIGYLIFSKLKTAQRKNELEAQNENFIKGKIEARTQPNSIYLFGGFTVRDRKNKDITYMFSAQLKQIFCLILQYSTTEKGITSQRLSHLIWPGKSAAKVKNSRGVTISHLRKTLNELEGIELIHEEGHFKIIYTDQLYCDYIRLLQLISENQVDENKEEFVEIVVRGKFLQFSDDPLFDSFKEETEKKLGPVLQLEMEKSHEAELYHLTIALADAIFNIDPLNDAALAYQIKAMQKLKMNDEAKLRFQSFIIEYKKIMGTDYTETIKV